MRASEFQARHRLSFWDSLIVATAVQGGAEVLLTEDLNAGQVIDGVRVVDPFDESDPLLRSLVGGVVAEDPDTPR